MFKKLIWSLLLLLIVTASFYSYKEYNRKPSDLINAKSAFKVTAADLVNEFEANEADANKKYLDKVIVVTGPLSSVSDENDSLYNITVGYGLHKVGCSIDKRHAADLQQLKISKTINIKGVCTGYLLDVELNRCVIIK